MYISQFVLFKATSIIKLWVFEECEPQQQDYIVLELIDKSNKFGDLRGIVHSVASLVLPSLWQLLAFPGIKNPHENIADQSINWQLCKFWDCGFLVPGPVAIPFSLANETKYFYYIIIKIVQCISNGDNNKASSSDKAV